MKTIVIPVFLILVTIVGKTIVIEAPCPSKRQNSFVNRLKIAAAVGDCQEVHSNPASYYRNFLSYNSSYYVADYFLNQFGVFDSNWTLLTTVAFNGPHFIFEASNNFYIPAAGGLHKTDTNLNILKTYAKPGAVYCYRGGLYDKSTDEIVVACYHLLSIDTFDRDLNLVRSITLGDNPHSLTKYQDKYYIGLSSNNILVMQNSTVIQTYSSHCNAGDMTMHLTSDYLGVISSTCYSSNKVIFIMSNGTAVTLVDYQNPMYSDFDLNKKVAFVTQTKIYTC